MTFKFEKLEAWQQALDYVDLVYSIAARLPDSEQHNIQAQLVRAATSVALNIAESAGGQTDIEQARLLGLAMRSLLDSVACQHIISRRKFLHDPAPLRKAYADAMRLSRMVEEMRAMLVPQRAWVREEGEEYSVASDETIDDVVTSDE